jgi:hypothetical protein
MGILVFERGDVDNDKFPKNYFVEAKEDLEGVYDDNVGTTGKGR